MLVLDDSHARHCLKQLNKSEYPMAFMPSRVFGSGKGRQWLRDAVDDRQTNSTPSQPPSLFGMPKREIGEERILSRVSIIDYAVYFAIAKRLALCSSGLLNNVSYSFRPSSDPEGGLWEETHPRERWLTFQRGIITCAKDYQWCAGRDIESFFPKLPHEHVIEALKNAFQSNRSLPVVDLHNIILQLRKLLESVDPTFEIGLPQGLDASFFLAELVLLPIDRNCVGPYGRVLRFVDDYKILGLTQGDALCLVEMISSHLGHLNFKKSKDTLNHVSRLPEFILKVNIDAFEVEASRLTTRELLRQALRLLDMTLDSEADPHWLGYLLAVISSCILRSQRIGDDVLAGLLNCYSKHSMKYGNAFISWRYRFVQLIDNPQIQELLGEILLSGGQLCDSDTAIGFGCFRLARRIHSHEMKTRLVSKLEYEACMIPRDGDGSKNAVCGKALRAAQRHGRGNEITMDVHRNAVSQAELRRYTAAALSDLDAEDRVDCSESLLRRSFCPEERFIIEHFRDGGDDGGPDGKRPVLGVPYPL